MTHNWKILYTYLLIKTLANNGNKTYTNKIHIFNLQGNHHYFVKSVPCAAM